MNSEKRIVRVTVDGHTLEAPEGTVLLQAMLDAGMDIPHYCYHPKLSIDGSCRLCQVKIEGVPKLQISCNTPVRDGMVVHASNPEVEDVRRGVLELLLLNHPLDCPICDKAGECWLQNYSMRFGSRVARTVDPRRKAGKRLDIGERMLLDQERCILCRRCVRFCREISRTGELVIYNLGDRSLLDIHGDHRLDNAYSMCTADVCPVGALETKDFHHRLRVWFLEETASVCPGCANGCNIMVCHHRNRIWRLMPRRNDFVNDTWMCDQGRLGYKFVHASDRLRAPLVRREGAVSEVPWDEAIDAAAGALRRIVDSHGAGAIGAVVSPHLTLEENFEFARLMREVGSVRIAMAVQHGNADDFLIKAEKASNARGVRELGLVSGDDDGLGALLEAAESGDIKALYVCGDDLLDRIDANRLEAIVQRLELMVVHALSLKAPLDRAQVIFPTTVFAEKRGAFVNFAGWLQLIERALEAPPGWLEDGAIFVRLRNHLTFGHERFDLERTREEIVRSCPAFSRVRFAELGPYGVDIAGSKSEAAGDMGLWVGPRLS